MRQTFVLENLSDLHTFETEFRKLADKVKSYNGKYVLHLDTRRSGCKSIFVSKADFDRVVSPTMYGDTPAFSRKVAGGKFLPDRLDAAYGALSREQARQEYLAKGERKIITNRQEYIAYYYGDVFSFYPGIGKPLNKSTSEKL